MLKKFIQKIAEAVMAILLPILNANKTEVEGKMDEQHKEMMGLKELMLNALNMLTENKTTVNELKASVAEKDRQIAQLKVQMDEIQDAIKHGFDQVRTQIVSVEESIPTEIKEKRLEQNQERAKKEMALPESTDEKPNYDELASKIVWQAKNTDVVIEDDMAPQLIQRLLVNSEIEVRFEAGKMVVSKKRETVDEPFDEQEAIREFEEKKMLAINLRYSHILEQQMAYVKGKIQEQIAEYQKNPYQYKHVLLSEPVLSSEEVNFEQNPMYIKLPNGYSYGGNRDEVFGCLPEVYDYMLKQGFVMEVVTKSAKPRKLSKCYGSWLIFGEGYPVCSTGVFFENKREVYQIGDNVEIYLHILTPKEKEIIK